MADGDSSGRAAHWRRQIDELQEKARYLLTLTQKHNTSQPRWVRAQAVKASALVDIKEEMEALIKLKKFYEDKLLEIDEVDQVDGLFNGGAGNGRVASATAQPSK